MLNTSRPRTNADKSIMPVRDIAHERCGSLHDLFQVIHKGYLIKITGLISYEVMRYSFYNEPGQLFKISHKDRAIIKYIVVRSGINKLFPWNRVQPGCHILPW